MKTFQEIRKSDYAGRKGFKNKDVASKGGKTAGRNKQMKAAYGAHDAMLDAALKQDKNAFDKAAKKAAAIKSKTLGFKAKPEEMWSVKKAKAIENGTYYGLPLKQRKSL